MSKNIDLTQKLSDEDRAYLEQRDDQRSLRVNTALVEGKEYVVREEPEVLSTEELSQRVAEQMLEDQKRQAEGNKEAAKQREQLDAERIENLRVQAEQEAATRNDEVRAAQGQATPVASKTAAKKA